MGEAPVTGERMRSLWLLTFFFLAACPAADNPNAPSVNMNFARPTLYTAPFPSADLIRNGQVNVAGFVNPSNANLVNQTKSILATDVHGSSLVAGVFFSLTGSISQAQLPQLADSQKATALTQLINLETGLRIPLRGQFAKDGGPYGAPNLVELLPLQGRPLDPNSTYAAVLLKHAGSASVLRASSEMQQILSNTRPSAMPADAFAAYQSALKQLKKWQVDTDDIAGLAVYKTDDPSQGLFDKLASAEAPTPPGPFSAGDVYDGFCVQNSTMTFANYQTGTPPYSTEGGTWSDSVQTHDTSRVVVSIPKTPMPQSGYPLAIFVRTGGGGDRPMVDRGVQCVTGGPPRDGPGHGPSQELARIGYAGLQVDGPLGGIRNPTGGDEELMVFNIFNGGALRDNIRESALEIAELLQLVGDLQVPDCNGNLVHFDTGQTVLMGHSMGASIAVPTMAIAPKFRAVVMSGAGASFIENLIFKTKPFAVLPVAEQFVADPELNEFDPLLSLVQWAIEPAEAMVYAPKILPRDILMFQGIADHYIPPPVANALTLSVPLDYAGTPIDATTPETSVLPTIAPLLPLAGRKVLAFPVQANQGGDTAVVSQFPSDGIEDGHEIMFQTEGPKHLYRCFLQGLLSGTPVVVSPDAADCGSSIVAQTTECAN